MLVLYDLQVHRKELWDGYVLEVKRGTLSVLCERVTLGWE